MDFTKYTIYSQILQNFIPVYKSWYIPTEIVLRQVSGTEPIFKNSIDTKLILQTKERKWKNDLQNLQVRNLRESWRNWSNELIIFQDSESRFKKGGKILVITIARPSQIKNSTKRKPSQELTDFPVVSSSKLKTVYLPESH